MTWPSVTINQLNNRQGTINEVERKLLFIGSAGDENRGATAYLSAESDIETEMAGASESFRAMLTAAQLNAGQNWQAMAVAYPVTDESPIAVWGKGVEEFCSAASFEGVVVASELDNVDDGHTAIELFSALRTTMISKYGRWVWFVLTVAGPRDVYMNGTDGDLGGKWADYLAFLNKLQTGIVAAGVQLVPMLWGNEAGALAGRLCDRSVTIADSPARVKTGAIQGLASSAKTDSDAEVLTLAHLRAMHDMRYSVPMWYADYEGFYWSDGLTLDVTGGDFPVIEYLRIVDKVARRVRIQAIAKIADRSLNSTLASIAAHKTYFSKTLRDMSKSSQINGVTFPGEVRPPQSGDVEITWADSKTVAIYLTVRPYASPKSITVGITLDDSLETE